MASAICRNCHPALFASKLARCRKTILLSTSAHALSSIPPLTAPSHCMASAICRNCHPALFASKLAQCRKTILLSTSAHAPVRFRRLRLHLTVWRPPYAVIVIRHSLQASLHSAVRQFFFPRLLMRPVRFRRLRLHLTVWRPPYAVIVIRHSLQASLHSAVRQFLRMSGLVSHLVQIVLDFPVCHLHTVCFILFLLCFDDLLC